MLTETLALAQAALVAIETWEPIRVLRTSPVLYPLLNGTHIAGFALFLGAIAVLDTQVVRSGQLTPDLKRLVLPIARTGFAVALLTGLALLACRPFFYLANPAMALKLGLLLLAFHNILLFHGFLRRRRAAMRLSAAASLTLWLGVLFAGRWIGFA